MNYTTRNNIAYAVPPALLCAVLCVVALPVFISSWTVVIGGAVLAFITPIFIFLYLQGTFSNPRH